MLGEEGLESGDGVLAAARGDEDHRLVLAVEVDEHGDVGLPALGGGLIEADGLDAGEVEALDRLADVMLDDAPQALIGDTDDAGGGQHRHLAHQRNGDLFEQEREAAALAGPRHIDPQHPMLGTVAARQLGDDAGRS